MGSRHWAYFVALHHEPDSNVNIAARSGTTAKHYAAMYRHVILRLRKAGMTNMVNVIAYMGNEMWMAQSWSKGLYPGDYLVDWIGLDSYASVEKCSHHAGGLADILTAARSTRVNLTAFRKVAADPMFRVGLRGRDTFRPSSGAD